MAVYDKKKKRLTLQEQSIKDKTKELSDKGIHIDPKYINPKTVQEFDDAENYLNGREGKFNDSLDKANLEAERKAFSNAANPTNKTDSAYVKQEAENVTKENSGIMRTVSDWLMELPDSPNFLRNTLGIAGGIAAINTGATINNYKRLKRFDDAKIAKDVKDGITGEKAYKARDKWNKFGKSVGDAFIPLKSTMPTYKANPNFNKSNPFVSTIIEGEGPIVRNELVYKKTKWAPGDNVFKTKDLFKKRKDVTVFPEDTKSTSVKSNIDNPKDVVVEKPITETSTKKVYQLGDGRTGLIELPEGKSSSNPRFIYNEKGQLIKNPKWKPADVNPDIIPESRRLQAPKVSIQKNPPNFISNPEGIVYDPDVPKIDVEKVRSGKLGIGFDPTSKPAVKVYKGIGKIAKTLLNNAAPIVGAITYGANEQESVDKYGVGAKAVVDNAINTTVDMVNPLNYLRMATAPTDIVGSVFKNTTLGNVANTVSGGMNKGIDFVENQVSNTFDKKLQEEKDIRSNVENKKMYKKMKETPNYDGLDLQKAVIYGDTKKSGSDALDKISGSTGIPRDVLISNAKKMWKKNKK